MMNNQTPFVTTRNLFRDYLNYSEPLSYAEWLLTNDDSKAAVLFVQFFDQITLAWYKTRSFYAMEEEAVETALQYLMKNVPVIIENPKRFNAKYIYRVMFNCLYCISHDRKCDRDRWELETSNLVNHDGQELNLFDTVANKESIQDILDREGFWELISSMGDEVADVVEKLLKDGSLAKNASARKHEIVAELRIKLAPYVDLYHI